MKKYMALVYMIALALFVAGCTDDGSTENTDMFDSDAGLFYLIPVSLVHR